ncbi:MAG: hypothetical protein V3U81_03485, partial [Candidatus Binatia bacterium]
VESRGHVNVQVGAGPYLRNKHLWGRIGGALMVAAHCPRLETSCPEDNQASPGRVAAGGPWSEGSPRSPKYQEWTGCNRHLPQSDTVKETSRTTLSDGEPSAP